MGRRLTAILAADVVGYSRLMGADEAGTLAAVKAVRKELFAPKVAEHHGRIVKLMGDGALVEFPSVVHAVQCAVEVQRALAERNAGTPSDKRVELRIGVNLGDIIAEGGDIYGDGVNVAARLEELAEPGGVALSGSVHDHVAGKVDFAFADAGEHELKNIARPVHVWRWSEVTSLTGTEGALPLPDKPSIAVLPFTNMSGDPEQEYFSDGITEDIITELSRFRSLFVIARNSSFTFKGQAVDVVEVSKRLGVRYVVEGSVRKAGNRVRVTAQLVEAATGNHLWAERYDRDLEDVFAVQDEVVRTITSTVGGRIDYAGQKRAERLSASDLQAYDHIHRATASINRFTKEGNARAREHLERAVALDPRSSQAHHQLSVVHFMDWMAHWVDDREKSLAIAYECAKKAVALDDTDGTAYAALGMCHIYHREFDDARHCFERALMLNPNDCHSLSRFGFYLTAVGRIDEALTNFDQSARINPLQPERVDWMRGITFFTARRYDEAIVSLRTIHDPINEVRGWLAASYAGAGRLDEARAMLEEFLRVAEDDMAVFPGRKFAAWEPFWHGAIEYQNEADFEHLYDALHKAGLEG
jgi:TolB-like protein/Flp pilus assembly protein TadD